MSIQRRGQDLIVSYLNLRAAIGFIAVLLALSLWPLHMWFVEGEKLNSISQSYYTELSAVLVGCLCAIGVFLMSYRGYERADRIVSAVAGASAIIVAQVPCACGGKLKAGVTAPNLWGWSDGYRDMALWPALHYAGAILLFLMLATFCLWLFPKSKGGKTPEKKVRNAVYRTCGVLIVLCMVVMGLDARQPFLPVWGTYWGEALMVIAFGLSWIVKGEALGFLNDPPARRRQQSSAGS